MSNHVHILWQLQLSVANLDKKFILTADSNWQIFVTKAINMVKVNPDIEITALVPYSKQCVERPWDLLVEHGLTKNVHIAEIPINVNPLATRYDFPWDVINAALGLGATRDCSHHLSRFTHVYINDPMLLRHYKALFYVEKQKPKFIVQTHFLDSPSGRIADDDISYWNGTFEAVEKADVALWHCDSMNEVFSNDACADFSRERALNAIMKCEVWKDGYSIDEIRKPVVMANVRFDLEKAVQGKKIVWIPNRVGGLGRSFDYTNNGKFMFEIVPELWKRRQDFVVIAGNPNQKISNDELAKLCPAYVKLIDSAPNRDEYRYLSAKADIVVALYLNDTNGGLASLESMEASDGKVMPLFPNVNEYKTYFDSVSFPDEFRVNDDLSNTVDVLDRLLDVSNSELTKELLNFVRYYAAYEYTTPKMMDYLGWGRETKNE